MHGGVKNDGPQRNLAAGGFGHHLVVLHPLAQGDVPALGDKPADHQTLDAHLDKLVDVLAQLGVVELEIVPDRADRAHVEALDLFGGPSLGVFTAVFEHDCLL
jgi:hypothetical protein